MVQAPDWLSTEPGEEVVWTGKPRIRRILTSVASAVLWSLVAVVAALVVTTSLVTLLPAEAQRIVFQLRSAGPSFVVWLIAGLVVLSQVANVVSAYVKTVNVDYVLTDRNVYKKTGAFSETVTQVDLAKIQNTELQKDFFGNTFDYGTILVSTAGGGGVEMAITDLDDPQELRNRIRTLSAEASEVEREETDRVHRTPFATADPDDVEAAVAEARSMRETAERIERQFT